MNWKNIPVLVTGGASFIGSHLVDALVEKGATVTVADNLSSGTLEYLREHIEASTIVFMEADLREKSAIENAVRGQNCVFHLAADHGGRGYIETHEAACAGNLVLDGMVFKACVESDVKRVIYASSGCVYPKGLQSDADNIVNLAEQDVGPPYNSDGMYGWAKLMGEMVLASHAKQSTLKAVSCRYFTAYGPRATESHAVMAMIAKAFIKQDPFEIWGTGEQIRNWTYVSDIVDGTLQAAEIAGDGEAFNVGRMEGTSVLEAANLILERADYSAKIVTRPDMPTGPYYRISNNAKLKNLTGWRPEVTFSEGLSRTMEWYYSTKSHADIRARLPELLFER